MFNNTNVKYSDASCLGLLYSHHHDAYFYYTDKLYVDACFTLCIMLYLEQSQQGFVNNKQCEIHCLCYKSVEKVVAVAKSCCVYRVIFAAEYNSMLLLCRHIVLCSNKYLVAKSLGPFFCCVVILSFLCLWCVTESFLL